MFGLGLVSGSGLGVRGSSSVKTRSRVRVWMGSSPVAFADWVGD